MPSTYTTNNGIELIATGEQSGTWGNTTNTNLELLDASLDGQVTVTLSSAGDSGSPNDLPINEGSTSNGRNRVVIFNDGGDLGATAYVQLTPNDAEKIIYIRNSLSGSRDLIVFQGTYNASNDYVVPNGTTAVVLFDGAGSGAVAANLFNNAAFDALQLGTSTVSVNKILDQDDMSSDDASALATQQSIKAYVDNQITAEDLDFAGDTGTGAVDLDSQTFTVAGTANEIETSASGQTLTVGLPTNVTVSGDLTVGDDVSLNSDGAVVNFGADSDVTLTHVADTALRLNSSREIQFRDADLSIGSSVDGQLDIEADTEVAITTATVDMSAAAKVGTTLSVDTISELTTAAGVTIDSVLLKDDVVNATDVETSSVSANDGTEAITVANTTGAVALSTSLSIAGDGAVVTGIKDEDDMSSDSPTKLATQQSIKAYVDSSVGATIDLQATLAAGNTSSGSGLIMSSGDDLTLTGAAYNVVWDSSDSSLEFADSAKAVFGTGSDLQIYHDGTDSLINDNGTGSLKLQTAAATKVEVTSAGIDVTGTVEFDGLSGTGSVTVTDILDEDNMASDSATALATQQSIKAYVDSQSGAGTLAETLTGGNTTGGTNIEATTTDKVQFRDAAIYINSSVDGQLDIVADTEVQIATTTLDVNGILDVSGNIVAGGTVDGRDLATDGTKLDGIEAGADVTDTANVTAAGALMESAVTNPAQVKAFDSADYATAAQGTTADSAMQDLVDDTTPQLGGDLASNGSDILFADNDKAIFGAGSDLQIYHDGSNSLIKDAGTGDLLIQADNLRLGNAAGTEQYILADSNDAVQLRYDGSTKLATTSTGIDVTGTIVHDGLRNENTGITATSKTLTDGENVTVTAATQTITLPASPAAGDEVHISVGDFTDTVIGRNSSNIMGLAEDLTLDVANIGVTLVYSGNSTQGWRLF